MRNKMKENKINKIIININKRKNEDKISLDDITRVQGIQSPGLHDNRNDFLSQRRTKPISSL